MRYNVCVHFPFLYLMHICGRQFLLPTFHVGVNGFCDQIMNDFSHQTERFHRELK